MTRPLPLVRILTGLLLLVGPGRPDAASAATPAQAIQARLDSLARAECQVPWTAGPPDSALARSAARPVFLDFYADWCAPCRWMDRAVYPDPLLAEAAAGVAMIRVDIETPAGRSLAARYDVHQYPTLVFLAPGGRETLRWPGPLSLRDTRLNLSQMASPSSGRFAIESGRATHPRDMDGHAAAILWYGGRGEVERARAIADSLEKKLVAGAPSPRPADLALIRLNRAKAEEMAGRTAQASVAYASARDADPEGVLAWRAWLGLSTAAEALRDRAAAATAAREAWTRHPEPWLAARAERLELAASAPALATPPGVDDGDAGTR